MGLWIFWGALGLTLYTYGGYLLVLIVLDAGRSLTGNAMYLAGRTERRRPHFDAELPSVSVFIAAHNEEACIASKLENTLALEYPAEKLQILVGSDGSTDRTDEIVRRFSGRGVLLSAGPRGGKVTVLNRLAGLASGRVWLFTDANTVIDRRALRLMVQRFADPLVGGVCGRLQLVTPTGAPASEGVYWRYENLLKFYESKRGALMGANGGLYLIKRSEWRALPPATVVDDFLATMRVVLREHRLLYDPEAVATEETAADTSGEFRRRVRISAGNFQVLRELSPLLVRPSFAGFAFWSHKVLRWFVPFLLLGELGANITLLGHGSLYTLLLCLQAMLIGAALLPRDQLPRALARICGLLRYFGEMNLAIALGFVRFVTGRQTAVWQRTDRSPLDRAA